VKSKALILGTLLACLLIVAAVLLRSIPERGRAAAEHPADVAPSQPVKPRIPQPAPAITMPPRQADAAMHPLVRMIIAEETGQGSRMKAAKSLSRDLSQADLEALMEFINQPREDLHTSAGRALVDAIINAMRRQETFPVGMSEALARLYRDSPDPVLQGYAIQYLWCLYIDRDDHHRHETDHATREMILTTLIKAASETDRSYSGTALMALNAITRSPALQQEPETRRQLAAHAGDIDSGFLKAASSPETDKLCRISALQVCAMRGLTGILPVARGVAADPKEDPNIRISAIAAIGMLGNAGEDSQLLETLQKQGARLAYAAVPALEKLTQNRP
jgi:hypothetical protein